MTSVNAIKLMMKNILKKILPAFIAIFIILIVIGALYAKKLLDKYSYGKEYESITEYFGEPAPNEAVVFLQDRRLDERARLIDGKCYFDIDSVRKYFNDRFYVNMEEGVLLYTTPFDIMHTSIGSDAYSPQYGVSDETVKFDHSITVLDDNKLYVSLEYLHNFKNFSYQLFTEPYRIQIYTEWTGLNIADVNKDTSIRIQGGIKSSILKDLAAGSTVTILEEMDTWSKVRTDDCIMGYIENKHLDNHRTQEQIPVTNYVEPEFPNISKPYTINMTWHVVGNDSANNNLTAALAGTKSINTISPTWFKLTDSNGNFSSLASKSYVDTAHSMGIEVWPIIDDFTNKDSINSHELFSRYANRSALITNIVNTIKTYGIDGINIDFENIAIEDGEHFIQFIRELSIACRKEQIVLSIDNYVPREHTAHYNRKEQGLVADYVIVMGYDEHWSGGGKVGSVASIGFVEEGIQLTVNVVPSKKVINAVPFYTRVWKTTNAGEITSEALGMRAAEDFAARHDLQLVWDETTCQNYVEYVTDSAIQQVWLEDKDSMSARLNIMKNYNLGGVASWRLGFEKPEIWDLFEQYVNGNGQ